MKSLSGSIARNKWMSDGILILLFTWIIIGIILMFIFSRNAK